MRKSISLILAAAMLFTLVSCGRYKIDNIEYALKVCDCSRENMFGLEQVAVFDDRIVVVFDKKTCDKNGKLRLDGARNVEVIQGKYIFTKFYVNGESLSHDMCRIDQGRIDFSDDDLELFYSFTTYNGQSETDYYQTYDQASGKWNPVTEESIDWGEKFISHEMSLSWTNS